jgi:hypothetical protein
MLQSSKVSEMISIKHNFVPENFMWLWSKYAYAFNPKYHCTNSIQGKYSKVFSKASNPDLLNDRGISFDEHSEHKAIYICGVIKKGYSQKRNYPHNVHLAIQPKPGTNAVWNFEDWKVEVHDGTILPIPKEEELDTKYIELPPEFTTCRIFRWASSFSPLSD